MIEDSALNAFLKRSLEGEVSLSAERLRTLESLAAKTAARRRWRQRALTWGGPALAASLLACFAFAHVMVAPQASRPQGGVIEVIQLLAAADGMTTEEAMTETSPADALLAWQEAPCADLL